MENEKDVEIFDVKVFRKELGVLIDKISTLGDGSREKSLAITKLQEGRMWLGQELGNLGESDLNAERDSK